ncbi:MAG: hypothetical protein PHV07_07730 [Oscillospiraceae bacterium]|nr:hypothetical protein [Oscillospiraceae bacterium]
MRQGGGRRRAIARRERQRSLANKRPRRLVDFYLELVSEQGWHVISCATADIPSFGGARQEFIAILERDE